MDILSYANVICIILLFLASVQDILKKSVSDVIHYLSLIFSISFIILTVFYGILPRNLFFGYLVLLMFLILYVLRLVAIGDLYVIFFLFYFISFLDLIGLVKFTVGLAFFGNIMHSIEAIKIYIKNKDNFKTVLFITIIPLIIISLSLFFYSLENLYNRTNFLLISSILLLIPAIVLKIYEPEIKKNLTFKRKVSDLVEGDWLEGEIEVKRMEFLDEIMKNFHVIRKDNKYIIKFNEFNWRRRIIIMLTGFVPFLFINNQIYFIVSILLIVLLLTALHKYIFRGELGLSKEQIDLLKRTFDDSITFEVIEGAPFIPAIFLSYIFALL